VPKARLHRGEASARLPPKGRRVRRGARRPWDGHPRTDRPRRAVRDDGRRATPSPKAVPESYSREGVDTSPTLGPYPGGTATRGSPPPARRLGAGAPFP